jgi:hypothetical protein
MESVDYDEKDIQTLDKLLVKLGVEVRYDLLGQPDEIIFDLQQLLRYSDFLVASTLEHYDTLTQDLEE